MDQNKTQARKREQIRDQLQSLPPEVRRYLLSLLDLPRLRGLVRASPIYHQQYLHDRHYLLSSSIETTLSNATVDAYAVYILSKDTIGPGSLALLIDNYTQPSTTLFKKAVEEECIGIAELYFTVRRVAERFSRQLLDDVARSTGQPQHREPSTMEMLRIIRASYRFDILCRLATPDDLNPSYEVRVEDAISFFNIIEPWEVDEVLSFCQFAQYIYGRSVDDIKNELQANNPRLDDHYRPTTPEGALPLDGFDGEQIIEGTMSKGIKLLDAVLFEIKDHGHPETKMQENILSWYIGLDRLTGHLSEAQLNMRRWDKPSERDRLELNRAPLEFSGDVEADSSGRMCPPLAWTTIWGGTYSNMYGWFTSDELRRWGYVFWDAARIKSTGVEALLEECWDYLWHGDDPRDDPSYWIGLPEEH